MKRGKRDTLKAIAVATLMTLASIAIGLGSARADVMDLMRADQRAAAASMADSMFHREEVRAAR